MGIETILTLFLAAALLGTALVMRVLSAGVYRLALLALGRERAAVEGPVEAALPRTPLRERLVAVAQGVGPAALYITATVWTWTKIIADGLVTFLEGVGAVVTRTYRVSSPHVSNATRVVAATAATGAAHAAPAVRRGRDWFQEYFVDLFVGPRTSSAGANAEPETHRTIRLEPAEKRTIELDLERTVV